MSARHRQQRPINGEHLFFPEFDFFAWPISNQIKRREPSLRRRVRLGRLFYVQVERSAIFLACFSASALSKRKDSGDELID